MTSRFSPFSISPIGPIRPINLIPFCLFLLFTLHPSLFGESAPQIRARIDTPPPIYTGQHITLTIELLAPGYFDSAPAFDLADPKGLLLIPPQGSPTLSTETINGTAYTVQRHELALFSPRAGTLTLPPITVRFAYKSAPLDTTGHQAELRTPALPFTVAAPPGSENLGPVISARNLTATETWRPELTGAASLKAGDALTRTITFTAPGIPGMIFPPFPHPAIDGLAIYAKTPEISDKADRGKITGTRRDAITYVIERPGAHTIPAARLTWFDLDTKQLRTIDFPARTLNVAAAPPTAAPQPGHAAAHSPRPPLARLAIVFAAIALLALALAFRHPLAKLLAPLRPVHLQPLNPPEPRGIL